MLILLAIPVIVAVAFVHRLIQVVAPSNLLLRSVRRTRPRGRLAATLVGLAAVLVLTMHVVADAVLAGAPVWLNLVVLVLAWDAIKIGMLACWVSFRWVAAGLSGLRTAGSRDVINSVWDDRVPVEDLAGWSFMAKRVQVVLIDDLDGSEADETVHFSLDDAGYEIDLSRDNASRLRDVLTPYLGSARKVGVPRRAVLRSPR